MYYKWIVACGGYRQVVKTSDCGSDIRGFESHYPPHFICFFNIFLSKHMKINKKIENIIVAIIWIGVICWALWITEGDVFEVALGLIKEFGKFILCALIFFVICLIFPKSWFAKIFKDKL